MVVEALNQQDKEIKMELEVIQTYANMALKLDKAERDILALEDRIRTLEATTIPEEEVKRIFSEPYEANMWVNAKYEKQLIKWYKSTGPWPGRVEDES